MKPRCVFFWEGESWQDGVGVGHWKGDLVGCMVKFSCVLELELSFDADELNQVLKAQRPPLYEKAEILFFPSGCNLVESFPFIRLAAKQLY